MKVRYLQDFRSWQFLYLLFLFPQLVGLIDQLFYYLTIFVLLLIVMAKFYTRQSIVLTRAFVLLLFVYGIFTLYAAVSMLWAPSIGYSFPVLIRLLTVCLVLIVVPALLIRETSDLYRLLRLIVYASIFIGTLVILGYLLEYDRTYRLVGTASHIGPGRIIGMGLPIAVFFTLYGRERSLQATSLVATALLVIAIGVSESRGPLLAAVISSLLIFTFFTMTEKRVKTNRHFLVGIVGGMVAVAGFLYLFPLPTVDRIIPIVEGNLDSSSAARLEFYVAAIHMWADSPIFGGGLASFHAHEGIYPHNIFLEILSGLGLIGLVLFSWVLLISVRSIITSNSKKLTILLLGLFVYILINASLSYSLNMQRALFFFLGASVSMGFSCDGVPGTKYAQVDTEEPSQPNQPDIEETPRTNHH